MRLPGEQFQLGVLMNPVTAITAGVGGVTSLVGGLIGSDASKSAAATQEANAQQVNALTQSATQSGQGAVQAAVPAANSLIAGGTTAASNALGGGLAGATSTLSDIYNQQLQNINPYLAAGQQGIQGLTAATGPGGSLTNQFAAPTASEVQATPGYQFTLDQGTQAIMRNAAATGLTGGTLKNINQFASGTASQYYQQAYNNALTSFSTNRNATMQNLSALLGVGTFGTQQFNQAAENTGNTTSADIMNANSLLAGYQSQGANAQAGNVTNAATQTANLGMQGAQIQGNALTGGANATAAGQMGSANAWSNALGGVANAVQYAGLSNALNPYSGTVSNPGLAPLQGTITPANSLSQIMPTTAAAPAAYNPNAFVLPGGQY